MNPSHNHSNAEHIFHNIHSHHQLFLVDTHSSGFRCNGCGCQGVGFRYRCQACDLDLHERCGTCPPTASFRFHSQHTMQLELAVFPEDPRSCDLCGTSIKGMHYRCRPCGFDVHPVCSQLPVEAVSPLHPAHLVTLTVAKPRKCTHCGADCLWRYRCDPCRIDLHPKCLLGGSGTDETPLKIPRDN